MRRFCFALICLLLMLSVSAGAGKKGEGSKEMKPALLVIDIQNQYLEYMDDDARESYDYLMAKLEKLKAEKEGDNDANT